ncbi:glycosyltransferase family 4 protein [Leptolyngbya sp. FACHB-261]|uniref:glycosyltransferase family 4 protein n=1 Tax=Leptolyngbya sp. FACHB-261 TaxID=2692806 RepID=UPI0028C43646|nr:glycosyltransferase family 4 protein [Leptolyngbya sp. FACHB-261]
MLQRGHLLHLIAPEGSQSEQIPLLPVPGKSQVFAQNQTRETPILMPENSVLANMWELVRQVQSEYDLIVNFAYDWLPFYLTPFLDKPMAHLVSMGSLSDALDQIIERVAKGYPGSIGVYTRTQAETFAFADLCRPLSSGLDLSLYDFNPVPESRLCWIGRIAPEKGLEDAAAAAQATGITLDILGKLQDEAYWQQIQQEFAGAPLHYVGFLPTLELQQVVRRARALVMTPKWIEAFGNVAIEALACGVPVIAYRRGGPAEIVDPGRTGWLVEPDSVEGLVQAIGQIDQLERQACRTQAEQEYSLSALGDRFEQWFAAVLAAREKTQGS